ncbi:MAG TPA: ATP-binding cassette domain-containing protein [archaeon]|nr:ATP-binding cassette domain-containing protein [archaeon]
MEDLRIEKQFELGIWLPGVVSKRDYLLRLQADSLLLGGNKRLLFPELQIKCDERIAVTGPNGSGKSTLIKHIVGSLNMPKERLTYIPQEIDARGSQELMTRIKDIPRDKLGILMTIVSRLGSRPQRLLDSAEPSPGETRKLLLALGMVYAPHIIVMDEPTNHMDLPSIECLEDALLDCPCSLILVSHDKHFLGKLTKKYWSIQKDSSSEDTFILNIRYHEDC